MRKAEFVECIKDAFRDALIRIGQRAVEIDEVHKARTELDVAASSVGQLRPKLVQAEFGEGGRAAHCEHEDPTE